MSSATSATQISQHAASFVLTDPENCIVTGPNGEEFQELYCVYPLLEYIGFPWEKYHINDGRYHFNFVEWEKFLDGNNTVPIVAVSLYVAFLYFGTKFFAKRQPLNLRYLMAAWNFGLALFSTLIILHSIPAIPLIVEKSLRDNICVSLSSHYRGSREVWTMIFLASKFAELFDTFFIIVHKKPLILLHWYHHITVLGYGWVAFQDRSPTAVFFGPMNAAVHAVMYSYYFLMTIKMKPKWFNAMWLTVGQIVQMVVGTILSVLNGYYFLTDDDGCEVKKGTMIYSLLMYGSYLFLFSSFFYDRYVRGNKSAKFAGEQVEKKYL